MKIFVFSPLGDAIGLCQQLGQENHDVMIHIVDKHQRRAFDGIVWKSDDPEKDSKQADVILFDDNQFGHIADRWREEGRPVINGSRLADRLEMDRAFGMKVLEKAGIPIPETFRFKGLSEALKTLQERFEDGERVVVKLDDTAGEATSYCGKDPDDIRNVLEHWDSEGTVDLGKGGILQKFMEGCEIDIEGWFNGESFMYPFFIDLELKKLANDNLGPNTGCAWNLVMALKARRPKLARILLEPLVPLLKKAKYVGSISVNAIVTESGEMGAMEFTPRVGYDSTTTQIMAMKGYGESLKACLDGERDLPLGPDPFEYLVGTRAWITPYPFSCIGDATFNAKVYDTIKGVPVEGWEPDNRDFVLMDVMRSDDGKLVCAGTSGMIGVGLGKGATLHSAKSRSLAAIEKIHVPNMGWRTDGGEDAKKTLDLVRRLGLI